MLKNTHSEQVTCLMIGAFLVCGMLCTVPSYGHTDGYFNVMSYGAAGTGDVDDSGAILDAIAAADSVASFPDPLSMPVLYFPPNYEFLIKEPIVVPVGISIEQHSPIKWDYIGDYPYDYPCLTIGESGEDNPLVSLQGLEVVIVKSAGIDWTQTGPNESDIGILLINPTGADIGIQWVRGFNVGVRIIGDGSGAAYNTIKLGKFSDNKVGLDLTTQNQVEEQISHNGYTNENLFIGGRFSTSSSMPDSTRVGVRMTTQVADPKSANHPNNNVFLKPSFELGRGNGIRIPILIEHGNRNSFINYRSEGNSTGPQIKNASSVNFFEAGYDGGYGIADGSIYAGNVHIKSKTKFLAYDSHLLASYNLFEQINQPHASFTQFLRMSILDGTTERQAYITSSGIKPNSDGYIEIDDDHAVGIEIDTRCVKQFVLVKADIDPNDIDSRYIVRPYDENGDYFAEDDGWVMATAGNKVVWEHVGEPMDFSNAYFSRNVNGQWVIRVREEVKKIWVGVAGHPNSTGKVVSFTVYTSLKDGCTGATVSSGCGHANDVRHSDAEPDDDFGRIGDIVWYTGTATQNDYVKLGWRKINPLNEWREIWAHMDNP